MSVPFDIPEAVPAPLHPSLGPALDDLRARPSRTWSLIVTFYGDAVVPRGGSLWLGTCLRVFALLDIGAGVVRTSMSRLAADGWIESTRVGRNSHYRLTARGRHVFASASARIYDGGLARDGEDCTLVVETDEGDRDALRAWLSGQGFGSPMPGLWIGAGGVVLPPGAGAAALRVAAAEAAPLARMAWRLDDLAEGYAHFVATFAPVAAASPQLAPDAAVVARLLLVHAFRRLVLRDPGVPASLLPAHWPGTEARQLCRRVYPGLVAASEPWLDAFGQAEGGALPRADPALFARFQL